MNHHFDVIILGGGASGLLCAVAAKRKQPQLTVAVIEKNDRVGKKLLATGNGRCNLTHDGMSAAHFTGSFRRQSRAVFDRIGTEQLLAYFRSLGLLTTKDSEGRYYPLSRQASSVLDTLRFHCDNLGVQLFCGETVKSIRRRQSFTVTAADSVFTAPKLVLATGAKAAPKLGGSGSGMDILKNLGHTVIPFAPALCPVKAASPVLKSLKGLRAHGTVTLLRGGSSVKTTRGEVQFNEDCLSGICVFDLSLHAQKDDRIRLDLLPDLSETDVYQLLVQNRKHFSHQTADNLLTGILQKRLAQAVLKAAHVTDFSRTCAALNTQELHAAAQTAKALAFTVAGNADFDRAQACKGGVCGSEIDAHTMQSKRCKGLYICGEAIDLCGACGGYNLHFAFASGIIAGENL